LSKTKANTQQIEAKFEETAFRLSQERSDFLLPQIADFVQKARWINLRPEYQRRSVWDIPKRSLFIESLLLNIPIPPIFLFEQSLGRYEVMDGQQRLNAVVDFYENGFPLRGLEKWSELNGKRFRDLPSLLQRGLDRRRISATVVLAESSKDSTFVENDLRKLVFERLNQGGQTLNAQELRNCLYSGCFNDQLVKLSGDLAFTEAWEIPSHAEHVDSKGIADEVLQANQMYKRMRDCELVLRFFALREQHRIKGSVKSILDNTMEEYRSISEGEADFLGSHFTEVLSLARHIFGRRVFRFKNKKGRLEPSVPLYDGVMVGIWRNILSVDAMLKNREKIVGRVDKLLANEKTFEIIIGRPNTSSAVRERLQLLTEAVSG